MAKVPEKDISQIAEEFDEDIEVFWQKHLGKISDKDIAHLMTGWIDYQTDSFGRLERKLNKIIGRAF